MVQSKDIALKGRNLIKPEYLNDDRVRTILNTIWGLYAADETVSAEKLINTFKEDELASLVARAVISPELENLSPKAALNNFYDSVNVLHRRWVNRQLNRLKKEREALEARGLVAEAHQLFLEESRLASEKIAGSPDNLLKGGDFDG